MDVSRREFVKVSAATPLAQVLPAADRRRSFRDDHDVDLPAWGPYTNRYIGISHVADQRRGLRFDVGIFPGYYRRKVTIPHGLWESDFYPWESSADLNYYSFRHQLEWKDRVYCDASYSHISDQARLIRCDCVNATARPQNLVINYIGYLTFPGARHEVLLPAGALWIDALDYKRLTFATSRPQDNLTYDGLFRGEAVDPGFVGGSGVGKGFGLERGDIIDYGIELPAAIPAAVVIIRYRVAKGATARVSMQPLITQTISLEGTGEFRTMAISCGALAAGRYDGQEPAEDRRPAGISCGALTAGRHDFRFRSEGGAAIDLDGFAIAAVECATQVLFRPEDQDVRPEFFNTGPRRNSLLLKYRTVDRWYGVAWNHPRSQVRQFLCAELDNFFRWRGVQDHFSLVLRGPGEGHFSNVFLRPIPIAPQSNAVLHGMVCDGTRAEVERMLERFPENASECEQMYRSGRERRVEITGRAEGRRYEFSQQRFAACSLTNVHYPVYLR